MRTIKLLFLVLISVVAATVMATNVTPQALYLAGPDYTRDGLETLRDDLQVSHILINLDPLGVAPDLNPVIAVQPPVLVGAMFVFGALGGWLLTSIAARKMRRQLREKRDETILLKAELHRVRQTLKEVDHPASATTPALR
ncbi:MAG: LapA family protein [Pseudomonadota bacterium]